MIGVFLIPTGIGAKIGGHAGDASPAAKLVAACCDKLILHPNVVNAADINEMPHNALYVEGSVLDGFLAGKYKLKEIKRNKVLIVANKPILPETINAVSAARATIGLEAEILGLETPLVMVAKRYKDGKAGGDVFGWQELCSQIQNDNFDALAIHTPITVKRQVALDYYRNGGVNPWGGVEAIASKLIANHIGKPVAHAPVEATAPEDEELYYIHQNEVVSPAIAPEAISTCYLHCVLKGLHKAPRISNKGIGVGQIDFLITPYGCIGNAHISCLEANIPIIAIKENTTIDNKTHQDFIYVNNYLEAAGLIMSMRAGVSPKSLTRPLGATNVR